MNSPNPGPSTPSHFILATAGHVDHGKSALVKALTGTDPDRLPEEKARGITIDLGFAHLVLSGHGGYSNAIHLGIVDVPGHEDFVSNMVAGVGSIDVALLVIAADDGWMPQTEEHLQILEYLGVKRAVVALSKIDMVDGDEGLIVESVRNRLVGTPFAAARVIPTSILSGRGLDNLKSALRQAVSETPSQRDVGKPLLAIDRAFTLRGIGAVVTGTLTGGSFERGQSVILQPSGQLTRIRTLQSHNQDLERVEPGRRVAMSLADVGVFRKRDSTDTSIGGVRRGQVVTLPEFGSASLTVDVVLTRSLRPITPKAGPGRPLKNGARVRIHHGTCNIPARVLIADDVDLSAGESAIAELRLEKPLFTFVGDRFIVRDWAEQTTIAGGVVLDVDADSRHFRNATQQGFLGAQLKSIESAAGLLASAFAREPVARREGLLARTHFSAAEIAQALTQLESAGKLVARGGVVANAKWWDCLGSQAAEWIDAHHRAHPEQLGFPLTDLRSRLAARITLPEAVDALFAELFRTQFVRVGTVAKRPNHWPALPPRLEEAGRKLREALSGHPLEPPSRKTLVPTPPDQEALRFLLTTGQVIEVGTEIVLLAEHYQRAVALIQEHLSSRPGATVSDIRQAVGTNRRVIVPLLEKLDREGMTRRQGDLRFLRNQQNGV